MSSTKPKVKDEILIIIEIKKKFSIFGKVISINLLNKIKKKFKSKIFTKKIIPPILKRDLLLIFLSSTLSKSLYLEPILIASGASLNDKKNEIKNKINAAIAIY